MIPNAISITIGAISSNSQNAICIGASMYRGTRTILMSRAPSRIPSPARDRSRTARAIRPSQHHAAVLRAALGRGVVGHRLTLAKAVDLHALGRHAARREVV